MSGFHAEDRARELEHARDRAFDALLEHEFGGEPPVDAIRQRAARGSKAGSRSWLAAALVLVGIGVTVALAWNARVGRDDRGAATPQDPDTPVDVRWPNGVRQIFHAEDLAEVPADATHLDLAMPLHAARDLSRFENLQHLSVHLWLKKMAELFRSGEAAEVRGRLDVLASAPRLRRLSLGSLLPLAAEDFLALRHLEQLQVLELVGLVAPDMDLASASAGGNMVVSSFDRSLGEAVAASSRAKTLRLSMPITVKGLRALAGAKLHSLILDGSQMTPEVLLAIGELTTLRRLELRNVHSVAVADAVGGSILRSGSRALTVAVMERIAALPELRSLTLDLCFLDHDLIAALPRQLHQLDISTCFGVDGRLADVVAALPELRELGLPLKLTSADDFMTMWRGPMTDCNAHELRLSGAEAGNIIESRAWQALRLDGRLTEPVAEALADQMGLQDLTLTPAADSVSLAFVATMPKLERVTFVQADLSKLSLELLNECASLRTVCFEDCMVERGREIARRRSDLGAVLRDDIVTAWAFRVVW